MCIPDAGISALGETMSDSLREVTSVSWFGRIRRSLAGLLFGLLLVLAMVTLLFWNEGRAVQTALSLAEGAGIVVSAGSEAAEPANEGKLVHVTGPVTASAVPADPDFGVSVQGVRLSRTAEMFQWKEEKRSETVKKLGGGEETVTTYSYSKVWDEDAINSSSFKQPDGHQNPTKEIDSRRFQIPDGKLGAFVLNEPVLNRIGGDRKFAITTDQAAAIDAAYTGWKKVSVVGDNIYLGFNSTTPAIGDYRISYELAPLGVISVIGKQAGDQFAPYKTLAGDSLLMVDTGDVPAEKMFADAVSFNSLVTWILRAVGILMMAAGFSLLLSPFGVLFDVIPFLGSIARIGTGIISFALAILVGTATIAIAWFWYRPLLSAGILAAGVIAALIVYYLGRRRGNAMPAPAPAQ